ncbi:hypothetical protein EKO27_g10763 [Xylaria grammica]|uniref:Uncharacterized protein n=1 Tax=Xylaria grammica TaxID=363999 RepID=A0A439CQH3_9PEZI|nr:hypothetical protein EKO27_g10763 [Xylaria grammica]
MPSRPADPPAFNYEPLTEDPDDAREFSCFEVRNAASLFPHRLLPSSRLSVRVRPQPANVVVPPIVHQSPGPRSTGILCRARGQRRAMPGLLRYETLLSHRTSAPTSDLFVVLARTTAMRDAFNDLYKAAMEYDSNDADTRQKEAHPTGQTSLSRSLSFPSANEQRESSQTRQETLSEINASLKRIVEIQEETARSQKDMARSFKALVELARDRFGSPPRGRKRRRAERDDEDRFGEL